MKYLALGAMLIMVSAGTYVAVKSNESIQIAPLVAPKQREFPHGITSDSRQSTALENGKISKTANKFLGNELLEQYRTNKLDSTQAKMMLDRAYSSGIEKSSNNYKIASDLLKSNVSSGEKVSLIRIVADQYTQGDLSSVNARILEDIRQLTQSSDTAIAREATVSYSRLGYFSDSEAILLAAKNGKYIPETEYYGELAHLLWVAPADRQKAIIDAVRNAQDNFSAEIIAGRLQDPESIKNFSPDSLKALRVLLQEREPRFPATSDDFDIVDSVKYANWLKSWTIVNGGNSANSINSAVMNQLSDPRTDPRQIVSYLISGNSDQFIEKFGTTPAFRSLENRIDDYAEKNKKNATFQDFVAEIHKKTKRS
ncbi:hypothetical protein [Undibacterium sp. Xuan67W]|uniref:hypothetical protein n=1 Tax=Undibacterium sp. Xuan67W TaxID=3413057 RepID=UPI003BF38B52